MPTEYSDSVFTREMKRLRLAAAYPLDGKSPRRKLPLKPFIQEAYKGRKVPLAVQVRIGLRDSALLKKVVEITYLKTTTNELKRYRIEPYSYRYLRLKVGVRKMVFGWDVKEQKIKGFAIRNIKSIKVTDSGYAPRFPVEIGKKIRKNTVRRLYKK